MFQDPLLVIKSKMAAILIQFIHYILNTHSIVNKLFIFLGALENKSLVWRKFTFLPLYSFWFFVSHIFR